MSNLIVILGNSYPIKNTLKTKGFRFDGLNKLWFKSATDLSAQKALSEELESEGVLVAFTSSLESLRTLSRAMRESTREAREPEIAHRLTGSILEMSKWYATKFHEQHGTRFAFRNLKVLKVKAETPRAYLMEVEFFGGISSSCGCCGKALRDRFSIATGIGPVCAERLGIPRATEDQAHLVIEQMARICREAGTFREVWIPKSQIKNVTNTATELKQTA